MFTPSLNSCTHVLPGFFPEPLCGGFTPSLFRWNLSEPLPRGNMLELLTPASTPEPAGQASQQNPAPDDLQVGLASE